MQPNLNSSYGLSFIAGLLNNRPGRMFFVSSVTTSTVINWVQNMIRPDGEGTIRFHSTIQGAMNAAVAGRGDVIFVLPGHTETISSASVITANKAGVSVIGLGYGTMRPTLTFTTAITANILVSAADVTFENMLFVANFADITSVFTVSTGPNLVVRNCEFRDTSAILNFITIVTTTVSVVADGLTFERNKVMGLGTTAATTPIKVLGTHNRLVINDNYISLGVLNNVSAVLAHGALVVTNLEINRNKVFRLNTDTATGGLLVTTSSTTNTGMISDNYAQTADIAGLILVTAGCRYGMFNNLANGDVDASGFVLPAIGVN